MFDKELSYIQPDIIADITMVCLKCSQVPKEPDVLEWLIS